MAEIVVGPVIDKLVELLVEEAKLFKGVHKDVESLKDELESIKCFLKDAEARSGKGETNDGVKIWMKQVRDEANHIEDVIDEYIRHVAPLHQQTGFLSFLQKIGRSIKRLKARCDIASEVQNIKVALREIKERSERYDFRSSSEEGSSGTTAGKGAEQYDPRLSSLFIEDDDIVGVDSTRDYLISVLVDGASTRTGISLVGAGGIGKTTLASKVYNNEMVKKNFTCRAWITVSQSYNMTKLLRNMTKQICINEECNNGETEEILDLISSLRQYLETQRYLVVFDDVWDVEFWELIKNALPKNDKGSRVILTTRNNVIGASACQETSQDIVHKMQPLSEEMAWGLFCKKAFRTERRNSCPKELEELSRKIIGKCQGLPLVVTSLACLLSRKEKTVSGWQKVLDDMSFELQSNCQLTSIAKILSLSYNDLPYHLKSCFLYFGIFPEDYSIADERLFNLWIAEGFVMPKRGKRLEDVAKDYLEELIHRNLVEVANLECRSYERTCKVHDVMREIILLKVEESGFCQILDERTSRFRTKYRRLSINGSEENVRAIVEDSGVRSIFIFNVNELSESFVLSLFKKFKLLRVLDFTATPLHCLPKEVGTLFHLKYLSLRGTLVKVLPKSLGKLQNLLTLDLGNTRVRELPFQINNFRNLRQFFSFHRSNMFLEQGVKIPRGVGCLENLQTLNIVEAQELDHIHELEKLKQLRALVVSNLTNETGKALCASIDKMNCLHFLRLMAISPDEILDLESISSPPGLLCYLTLEGPLQKLPHWISVLHNLLDLRLRSSNLHDDPLKLLQALPNLQRVLLERAYHGEQLHFEEGGFQKLKVLSLSYLVGLKVVKIDRGALPCLETLSFVCCPLKEVPSGTQHLTNLRTLRFYNMAEEFVGCMEPEGGQDYWKVSHIQSVTFWKNNEQGRPCLLRKLRESDPLNSCCARHVNML